MTWKKMKGMSLPPPLKLCRHDSIMAGKHFMKDTGLPALLSPWYLRASCHKLSPREENTHQYTPAIDKRVRGCTMLFHSTAFDRRVSGCTMLSHSTLPLSGKSSKSDLARMWALMPGMASDVARVLGMDVVRCPEAGWRCSAAAALPPARF
jgi:hypothetical protein